MTVAGMNLVHSLGITRRELIPVATNVNAAGANGLNLVGGMFITIASTDQEGNIRETRQMCYISEKIFVLYLSEQACKDLRVLQEDFPNIPTHQGRWNSGILLWHTNPDMFVPI